MKLIPKLHYALLVYVLSVGDLIAEDDFKVVYSSSGLEQLYKDIIENKCYVTQSASAEKTSHKDAYLCSSILHSPFFADRYEYQDPRNGTVHEFMRQNGTNSNETCVENPCEAWLTAEYEYRPITVMVLGTRYTDNATSCLAAERRTRNQKLFLVSHEYIMTYKSMSDKTPAEDDAWLKGHFVFEYDEKENSACLVAVAEPLSEIRASLEGSCAYDDYQEYKSRLCYAAGSLKICNFTEDQKVRLCTVGHGAYASEFRTDLKFLPYSENVEPKCAKIEAIFDYHHQPRFSFSACVIGCKSLSVWHGNHTTLYISLGLEENQLLMYEYFPTEGNIKLSCKLRSYLLKY